MNAQILQSGEKYRKIHEWTAIDFIRTFLTYSLTYDLVLALPPLLDARVIEVLWDRQHHSALAGPFSSSPAVCTWTRIGMTILQPRTILAPPLAFWYV